MSADGWITYYDVMIEKKTHSSHCFPLLILYFMLEFKILILILLYLNESELWEQKNILNTYLLKQSIGDPQVT